MAGQITAGLVAFLIVLKPVFDSLWFLKFYILGLLVNIQGLAAILGLVIGLMISGMSGLGIHSYLMIPRRLAVLFLLFSVYSAARIFQFPPDFETVIRYWTALAAFPLGFILVKEVKKSPESRRWIFAGITFSIMTVFSGAILQLTGYLPYFYHDTVIGAGWVARSTGLYYHPLDLMRVLCWLHLGCIIILFMIKDRRPSLAFGALGIMSLTQLFVFRTTHRTSLIFSVLAPLALGIYFKKPLRAAAIAASICLIWVSWGLLTSNGLKPGQLFHRESFVDTTSSNIAASTGVKKVEFLRGRSGIWLAHWEWIKTFSPSELLLGYHHNYTNGVERLETHNQAIELFEVFGVLGSLLIAAFLAEALILYPSTLVQKLGFILVIFSYSLVSEPLGTPSFVWMGVLFMAIPFHALLGTSGLLLKNS